MTKTAFVTGATGFIGFHVASLLIGRGWNVRALRREGSRPPVLPGVEWRIGDLRDPQSLVRAMTGCEAVFHVAADYRLWAANPQDIYESNVGGTANVLDAALKGGAGRVVYTSSVGALGLRADGTPADETAPVCLEDMIGHYKRSKFLAERKAEEFLAAGLPVVMVHPSTPVGPCDRKPTPTGKIIVDFLNGRMPAYLDTGLNVVHVRDVAEGHLLALERGRIGEKYILGNRNLTLADILKELARIAGLDAPRIRLPYGPVLALAHLCEAVSRITRSEPMVPLEGVRMARHHMFFDSSKAVRELGLLQTPVETALSEAVEWFIQNGYTKKR
ncbi:MAG: hopanoid-associated sugar epimerase [Acidobacteriota bacterium]